MVHFDLTLSFCSHGRRNDSDNRLLLTQGFLKTSHLMQSISFIQHTAWLHGPIHPMSMTQPVSASRCWTCWSTDGLNGNPRPWWSFSLHLNWPHLHSLYTTFDALPGKCKYCGHEDTIVQLLTQHRLNCEAMLLDTIMAHKPMIQRMHPSEERMSTH